MPEPSGEDKHEQGDFEDTSLENVNQLLQGTKAIFQQGIFPGKKKIISDQIALVHLDADLYQSTKQGLEFFWPRLVSKGWIICDDYNWPHCPGVKKAVDEFCKLRSIKPEIKVPFQCILWKK